MGWVEALRELVRRTSCLQLVKYQAAGIEFSRLSGEVSGAKFSPGQPTSRSSRSDQLQRWPKLSMNTSLSCQLSRELSKQDSESKVLLKLRSTAISLITIARVVFEAFKIDPENRADNLDSLVQRMQHLVDSIVKKATEDQIGFVAMPGQGLTGIRMEPIMYALQFVGIDENELDRMIAAL